MSYDGLRQRLQALDEHISRLNIRISPDATLVVQMNQVRDFLAYQAAFSAADLDAEWGPRFREFYDAQLAVNMLCDAVTELLTKQNLQLSKYLRSILSGSITQGGTPEHARNLFYELWLAALLSEAEFTVQLKEPDIVVAGNGLSQPIGIACKYPASEMKLHENVSKGYSQLAAHNLNGFVALGFDQIVVERAELKGFIDFRRSWRHPQSLLQSIVNSESAKLVQERSELYPNEDPIDELMLTVSLGGIYGNPAAFRFVGAVAFQASPECTIRADIQRIADGLRAAPAFSTVANSA